MEDDMRNIRKYAPALLFVSCMCWPKRVENVDSIKPSSKTFGSFVVQVKDTVLAAPYISASIVAGVLTASYFCYKYFLGSSASAIVKPIVKQVAEPIIEQAAKPVVEQEAKPSVKQEFVMQKQLVKSTKTVMSKKSFPGKHSVAPAKQEKQVVKVLNDQDQSLDVYVSNGGRTEQFSIPKYHYSEITRN